MENGYILTDDDLDYVHDRSRTLAAYAERTGQTEVRAFVELNRKHRGPRQVIVSGQVFMQRVDRTGHWQAGRCEANEPRLRNGRSRPT